MPASDLSNRLKKRFSVLQKWAKRSEVSCFRVYNKDLPDYPLIVEWFEGAVLVWVYDRKRDETEDLRNRFWLEVREAVLLAFGCDERKLFMKSRRPQRGVHVQYEKLGVEQQNMVVQESGLQFELNLSDYLDVGLFLDHRFTRNYVKGLASGKRVLNLFAYSGSFSCYAAAGGAVSTTTVDMSATYIAWAKRNMALNGFSNRRCDRFIVENCLAFLKNERSHNRYDLIICDPPTFSQSKRMKSAFSINEDYPALIRDCLALLAPGGILLFSTNSKSFNFDASLFPAVQVQPFVSKGMRDFEGKLSHRAWEICCG